MLILRASTTSPFARKVKLAAQLLGLAETIRIENADTLDPKDSIREQNPLGKIPILILEDGTALYDSRVILEYLDERSGDGQIIPRAGAPRIAALRWQALADGLMDAAILQIYEQRFRPEERREPKWIELQAGKVERALAELEREPPSLAAMIHVGHIALACALGYLDFRFEGRWRADHPRLVRWLANFAARVPAFEPTKPN